MGRSAPVDCSLALGTNVFKRKSVPVLWEFMSRRSAYGTPDMGEQGRLLNEVPRHVDAGAADDDGANAGH